MVTRHEFEPKMLGFLCNWCCYAGADLAGVSRYQYPPNVRVIRLMCSGRVDPSFILRAFSKGIDGVFIGGCWLGECHYLTQGNYQAISMMHLTRKLLKQIGIDPERLRLEWVSASEGIRFAEVISDFTSQLKKLGPLGIDSSENGTGMRIKLEAANSLVPYLRLVGRERLRVHFETREEYEEFFNSDEVDRLFNESVSDELAMKQILLLMREKPLSIDGFSEIMGLSPSEISRYLNIAVRKRLIRFDEGKKRFALA